MRRPGPAITSIRSSPWFHDDKRIDAAWKLPVAKLYNPLQSQTFTSICGPTSAANVLRSMGVKANPNPFKRFGVRAMSLDQLALESADIVPRNWKVKAVRPRTADELRVHLLQSNDEKYRYVSNFSRLPLFSHGGGHHSPVGGYVEEEDLVFMLDVNAGYGPWLVKADRLFDAMNTDDWGVGLTRGLVMFERVQQELAT